MELIDMPDIRNGDLVNLYGHCVGLVSNHRQLSDWGGEYASNGGPVFAADADLFHEDGTPVTWATLPSILISLVSWRRGDGSIVEDRWDVPVAERATITAVWKMQGNRLASWTRVRAAD